MTGPVDVLLIERGPGGAAATARALGAAGHRVHRCTGDDGAAPCRGVADLGDCPVERAADVALVAPGASGGPVPVEQSASCAVRSGVPVVEIGRDPALDAFAPWLAARLDAGADPVRAAEAAAASAFAGMEQAVTVMTAPVLRDLGVDPADVACAIERHGTQLRVRVDVPVGLDEGAKQSVAVRALAALRDLRRGHTSVSIGVHGPA